MPYTSLMKSLYGSTTAFFPPAAFSMVGTPTTNCPIVSTVPEASVCGSCWAAMLTNFTRLASMPASFA